MKTVELTPAFEWTCENCGKNNFVRGVVVPPAAISLEDLDESVQDWIESGESGDFVMKPRRVKCRLCQSKFKTEVV